MKQAVLSSAAVSPRFAHRDADGKTAGLSNSVRRALSILGLLNTSPRPLSFSDIKLELDLPKSTTSLLLATLESLGYLTRDNETRRYWLTPGVYKPGFVPLRHLEAAERAMPALKSISATISLTSFISVLEGDQVLFLLKADGPHRTSCDVYPGRKANAQCTAVGKILLAWMDQESQKSFLHRHQSIPHTSRTITSNEALLEELRRVRQAGYAIDDQEEALGIRCLAVPVLTPEAPGTISLGITGNLTEIRPDNIVSLTRYLRQMAQRIGRYSGNAIFSPGPGADFTSSLVATSYQ
jgi:IclR family KDG regulon transcriptional repressor